LVSRVRPYLVTGAMKERPAAALLDRGVVFGSCAQPKRLN
jgi:hypothetical protein